MTYCAFCVILNILSILEGMVLDITYLLMIAAFVLGAYLAITKKQKEIKRQQLIDKCLEKYANEVNEDKDKKQ